jgi:hypothetical protein
MRCLEKRKKRKIPFLLVLPRSATAFPHDVISRPGFATAIFMNILNSAKV